MRWVSPADNCATDAIWESNDGKATPGRPSNSENARPANLFQQYLPPEPSQKKPTTPSSADVLATSASVGPPPVGSCKEAQVA